MEKPIVLDRSQTGDWYNIPEVVCSKLQQMERRLVRQEQLAESLEVQCRQLDCENQALKAANNQLRQQV